MALGHVFAFSEIDLKLILVVLVLSDYVARARMRQVGNQTANVLIVHYKKIDVNLATEILVTNFFF